MIIPNSITSIGFSAFGGTAWYNNQPNGLIYAGCVAYEYKGTMPENTSITIKEGTTSISPSAFYGCSGLTSVTIPNSITSIGHLAFIDCNGLTSVISEIEEAFAFGTNAFSGISSTCTLTVPYGTTDAYIAAGWTENVFHGGIIEMPDQQSVTIGSAGIATFCSTKSLDFSGRDDVKAYIVSMFRPSTGEVTLTRVTDVPANTGLVLKGAADTYDIPVGTGETVVANMLVGVTSDTQLNKEDGEYTNYILAKKNDETGFFAVADGSTLGANKAYLPLPTASLPSSAKIRVIFEDEAATGIESTIAPEVTKDEGIYYNLQGQRVEQPTRGIYIVNGKKVWMK